MLHAYVRDNFQGEEAKEKSRNQDQITTSTILLQLPVFCDSVNCRLWAVAISRMQSSRIKVRKYTSFAFNVVKMVVVQE